MNYDRIKIRTLLSILAASGAFLSCTKLVTIDPPVSSITTEQVFSQEEHALAAMAGAYTLMINGTSLTNNSVFNSFSAGLSTNISGLSSDELATNSVGDPYYTSKLTTTAAFYGTNLWTSAYRVVYAVNAVIEGIDASHSADLSTSTRTELTGEAKFIRAFCYFYLVNHFGDVPLVLTVDFNQTASMARTPKMEVYQQILNDLMEAEKLLPSDFSAGHGERIVPNAGAVSALLARVYLYLGDYENAATYASKVINDTENYSLVTDLNGIFLKNSREAIWQLQHDKNITGIGTAILEAVQFIPYPDPHRNAPKQFLSQALWEGFETGDSRRLAWTDSTDNSANTASNGIYHYPLKYKTGAHNRVPGAQGDPTEYYTVLRLAELYLIRAESQANGAAGGAAGAIADLNEIRRRAGLDALPNTLTGEALMDAVMQERRIELFAEWGHRWFDLIRTGKAHDVLSVLPWKQPWEGDHQLLYPIPQVEIVNGPNMVQNPGYF